jgi:histidinol-phosphate aminotransferase
MIILPPRPGLLDIAPYKGGESRLPGRSQVIKLSSNESAWGPSTLAVEAIAAALPDAHRYPDGHCTALRAALAARENLDADRIVCGAGSDELIALLARAYAGPGDEVLYTEHGFLIYPIAALSVGAKPVKAPERNLKADVDALLAAVTERTRIVFIANPNNPTGSYLAAAELTALRDGLPDGVLLVIDAAYAEFVGHDDYDQGFGLVERGNTVVTRTFSKVYGLGGVRLGWGYCPPAIADILNRLRLPFNVSNLAQAAGIAALADHAFLDRAVRHNAAARAWLTERLRALGLRVADSAGNFVLVRFPDEPSRTAVDADAHLKANGIIARRVAAYGLPGCLRISIGLMPELEQVAGALAAFMERPG